MMVLSLHEHRIQFDSSSLYPWNIPALKFAKVFFAAQASEGEYQKVGDIR
jgi:hypothetical protein